MRVQAALVIAGLTLVACGSDAAVSEALEPPPTSVVSGLRASAAVDLGVDEIASDALDPGQLRSLLEEAGFESGVERSYSRGRGPIRRVMVRVVRFSAGDGAALYLSWLQEHVDDVIGDAHPAAALTTPRTSVFVHLPDGCCPRETAVALAAWRDGRDVLRVLVSGAGAVGAAATGFVTSVNRWREGP